MAISSSINIGDTLSNLQNPTGVPLYTSAYLAEEFADHAQHEHRAAASRGRLARLAATVDRRATTPASFMGRLAAAIRPTAEPCSTSC
jgi:hypothetical protein